VSRILSKTHHDRQCIGFNLSIHEKASHDGGMIRWFATQENTLLSAGKTLLNSFEKHLKITLNE
jgi:hypothetical protein